MSPSFSIRTLGCKVNWCESEAIRHGLLLAGFREALRGERADVSIVNTCAVTGASERKSRKAIRRARRESARALLVATGCLADYAGPSLCLPVGAGLSVGNEEKKDLPRLLKERFGIRGGASASAFRARRTRAFLKIQDGCEYGCAYCVIPSLRGPMRSRPREEVLQRIASLAREGFREVVLTGVRLGSYGKEGGEEEGLADLLHLLSGPERIRLSSIEPWELSAPLLEAMAVNPRICRHLHLPLQSGSTRILRRMCRPYTREGFLDRAERARRALPGLSLTTDVMVGFPGEEEGDFAETLDAVRRARFAKVHIFPFSPRPGTRAFFMHSAPSPAVVRERCARLKGEADRAALAVRRDLRGCVVEVLVEGPYGKRAGGSTGLTRDYMRVFLPRVALPPGELVEVTIRASSPTLLIGDPAPTFPAGCETPVSAVGARAKGA